MSQHLLWEVVKYNNAFLVKNNGVRFSRDPFNPTGVQTYSSTGFIAREGIAVNPSQEKTNHANTFSVQMKKKVQYRQKSRGTAAKNVQKNARHSVYAADLPVRHGLHTVSKIIRKRFGARRQGLQKALLRRAVKLNRANQVRRRNELVAAKAQKK